jgi:hypothetical protein
MSPQDFIQTEAVLIEHLEHKDKSMVWKAVECGAMDKIKLYAESLNYDVTLEELEYILWLELCLHSKPEWLN